MKHKITIRKALWFSFLVLLLFILRPFFYLGFVYLKDHKASNKKTYGIASDASNLNETKVDTIVKTANNADSAIIQIKKLIKVAIEQHKPISIAGARHSMGGHTITKNGIVLDMKGFNHMKLEPGNNVLIVGSGALWSAVIPYLDRYGKSVKVMQSNNSFSVGGSISVNCHGWQVNSAPIAATVLSFRLINSNGAVLTCSRTENSELFSLVLGGYGLFGVILDLKLKVTDNHNYITKQYIIKTKDYFSEFKKHINHDQNIEMAYGRININPYHFMEEAILSTYALKPGTPEKTNGNTFPAFRRTLFRGSANSTYGKNLRWSVEKIASHAINGKVFSRNKLLSEGVEVFQNTNPDYTDILHEYFVPCDSLAGFIGAIQKIIPNYHVDLLNITVRNVLKDKDTFLSYANEDVFGLVMLFNQRKDETAEHEMSKLTQALIQTAIRYRGTYYLPYRIHASKTLMYKAYSRAQPFFQLKLKYDPHQIFRNMFYEKYKSD